MKRIILSLMIVAGFTFLGTTEMEAQLAEANTTEKTDAIVRPGFTDSNNDGICDHYKGQRAGKGLGPGNGKGEGRASGQRLGRGKGLRDGSGLGLRDGSGQGLRDGSGNGQRKADGTGNGQRLRDGSGPGCSQPVNE